jgi:phage recombination protein Bet
MSTGSALAVREHGALAIEAGQTRWTEMQEAAFGQLGIADAPEGDKGVFLHVSQRTGLDPFSRQIYMIPRWDYQAKKNKYTIQTGIEGFRVMRSRAERLEGVRGILSRPVYYDREGKEFKVWFFQQPPVAVEMTYTVRDRNGVETPYTSILRFDEYRQTRKDGDHQVLSGQWATKPCHMLEKCVEADVYRKAFPQDFSGVQLDDAMPLPDPDDAPAEPQRQRVTAAQAAQRRPQTVTATVVTPDAAPGDTTPSPEAAQAERPPALIASGQKTQIEREQHRLGYSDSEEDLQSWLRQVARLVGLAGLASVGELTQADAAAVIGRLKPLGDAQDLMDLLDTGEVPQ